MENKVVINCKPLSSQPDMMERVDVTYHESFPSCERRDFALVKALYENDPRFTIYILTKDNAYAGFITAWDFDTFVYVEHFAIDPSARNGGIGGKGFRQFMEEVAKPIVLEVEPPSDDLSTRRIGFYERLGFSLDSHSYFQPPYRPAEQGLKMLLMSFGDINLANHFELVRDTIYKYVYNMDL